MTNQTMNLIAQTLVNNRKSKNRRVDGVAVGVEPARQWAKAVKAMRLPAYAVRQYRHANMGNAETVEPYDMTAFYASLKAVLDLIGEVNGAKLDTQNMAEEVLAYAVRSKVTDLTQEMRDARTFLNYAKKAITSPETIKATVVISDEKLKAFLNRLVETIDNEGDLDAIVAECSAEVKRLENEDDNCIREPEIQKEATFVRDIEMLLGDAINGQAMKTPEQVAAEEEAKRQARRAKTAAKRAAKKNA